MYCHCIQALICNCSKNIFKLESVHSVFMLIHGWFSVRSVLSCSVLWCFKNQKLLQGVPKNVVKINDFSMTRFSSLRSIPSADKTL